MDMAHGDWKHLTKIHQLPVPITPDVKIEKNKNVVHKNSPWCENK